MKDKVKLKLDQIGNEIVKKTEEFISGSENGILSGDFGILLFLLYYNEYKDSPQLTEIVELYAEKVISQIPDKTKTYTYSNGLAGILYLLEFFREKELLEVDLSETEDLLEDYLIRMLEKEIAENNWDFLHGATGIVFYFVKKKRHPEQIDKFIDYLYKKGEKGIADKSFKWKSVILPEEKTGYNPSLSHGMSALIILFSRILLNDSQNKHVKEMLYGTVNYILSLEIDFFRYGSHFPTSMIENKPVNKSRLAWCYGDLGIAFALWQAGKVTGQTAWCKKASEVFRDSALRRDTSSEGIIDAGICHGPAGLGLIFRRIYMETGLDLFKETADYWFQQTLQYARFTDGVAGYKAYVGKWVNDYSFLIGIAGIGLTFLSYLENDSQDWDEILLLSY